MQHMTLPAGAADIIACLTSAGYHAYIVGGSTRDALRGLSPHDYDMTTDATPAEMQTVFRGMRVIETGIKHGTLTILADGAPYEVTTYRVDGDYHDHRHPDAVIFTRSLEADLARRDFTMNAIAYHPAEGYIDPFGGKADIEHRIIRAVGEPVRRFNEDALRILRGLRFASSLGYEIEPATAAAMYETRDLLIHVSAERVREELCKLLVGDHATKIIQAYRDILAVRLPLLNRLDMSTLPLLSRLPLDPVLRLTALLMSVVSSPEEMDDVMREFKFDNASRLRAVSLISHRDTSLIPARRAVLHLLTEMGPDILDDLCALRSDEATRVLAQQLVAENAPYRISDLALTGKDILASTSLRGTAVGDALHMLLTAVIDDKTENTRDALLQYLLSTL